VVFAKALATLDVLSKGRLDLGVGIGWQREEYDAAGLAFHERGRLLDDTLAVLQTLWRESPASYRSPYLAFDRVWLEPKPLQPGGVPIWVSGRINARTLDRIVRFGAGWIPWAEYRADIGMGLPLVREALEAAGRDPKSLQIRHVVPIAVDGRGRPALDEPLDAVPGLVEQGITDIALGLQVPDDPSAARDLLAAVVAGFAQVRAAGTPQPRRRRVVAPPAPLAEQAVPASANP
jgi:alkanesulfonate monooxygenase SsuD/methylene tetrahydromethanopterin reductase-like flavin-dependent oxidoreductase (luciferase family)